jgi:membrane-bound metal-dependent hydrolase YbcI (DUF457 family)
VPFTPFHFGPALLFKGCIPKHSSFTTFVLSQVVIDSEVLYYMSVNEYPLHRALHTLPGAALAGSLAAVIVLGCRWAIRRSAPKSGKLFHSRFPTIRSESSTIGIWIGGLVGGVSHVLLDSLIYQDVHPFWPWTEANPLLGMVGASVLLDACVIAGAIGLVMVGILAGSGVVNGWKADNRMRGAISAYPFREAIR